MYSFLSLCSQRWRSSIQSAKTRPGTDCGSDHELLITKFRLKLKRVGKATRPCRYDLNQILYNYTVEVRNRFKGLDLIDSSVQSLSHIQLFVTPWNAAQQAFLSITNSQSSPKLMSIESVMPSSHLILCCLLFLLPPIPPSIRVFSNESTLHMVGKVLELQL